MDNSAPSKYQNPLAYLKLFFRRKWFFIVPLIVGTVLGIVAMFVLPPTFESGTLILVEEQRTINPLIQDLAVSTSVAQRLQSLREQILSWNNLNDLIAKLGLAKEVQNQLEFEDLVKDLRKGIQVQMTGPNLFKISYRNQKPQVSFDVVKTLTDIFIQENMRSVTKETDLAISFLNEQLQVYKKKIKEAEIARLQDQLNALLVDSTEEHPMVRELRAKLDAAKAELESGQFKVTSEDKPLTSQMRQALQAELSKITQEEQSRPATSLMMEAQSTDGTDQSNQALYKLFLMDKLDMAMARDMAVNERIYNMLLERLETAKITQRLEASKQGTRYTIIDPPRLPLRPVKPPTLMLLLGIFLGGASGVGLVFGREFLDQSFLDIEDAKQNLAYPVLGAISKITTSDELKIQKAHRLVWTVFGGISAAVVVGAAVLFAVLKR